VVEGVQEDHPLKVEEEDQVVEEGHQKKEDHQKKEVEVQKNLQRKRISAFQEGEVVRLISVVNQKNQVEVVVLLL